MDARLHVSRLSGQATVPPSKSAAHRAVLCAALADGVSHITNIEYSQDIRATLGAVTQLGAKVAEEPAAVTITGPAFYDPAVQPDGAEGTLHRCGAVV